MVEWTFSSISVIEGSLTAKSRKELHRQAHRLPKIAEGEEGYASTEAGASRETGK